jgi:hypothetical protein
MNVAQVIAALTALVALAAVGLQFGLTHDLMKAQGASFGAAAWRFFGYFTIISNCIVVIVAGAMASRPSSILAGPRARLAAATAIGLVGITYSIALRGVWTPTGWQAVADHALHDATPPLFLLAWFLSHHGALRWRDCVWALPIPGAYCIYALARGALDGWYAYWFLNPAALGTVRLIANAALLLVGFLLFALVLIAIDRWIARRAHFAPAAPQ